MPDTICHSVQGGLMVAAPFVSQIKKRARLWGFVVIATFMGALPDILGAHGNYVEHDNWREYRVAHFGSAADGSSMCRCTDFIYTWIHSRIHSAIDECLQL